jgi:hypothetical protein
MPIVGRPNSTTDVGRGFYSKTWSGFAIEFLPWPSWRSWESCRFGGRLATASHPREDAGESCCGRYHCDEALQTFQTNRATLHSRSHFDLNKVVSSILLLYPP